MKKKTVKKKAVKFYHTSVNKCCMKKSTLNKGTKTSNVRGKVFTAHKSYLGLSQIIRKKQKLPGRNMGKGYEPTIYIRRNPNGQ